MNYAHAARLAPCDRCGAPTRYQRCESCRERAAVQLVARAGSNRKGVPAWLRGGDDGLRALWRKWCGSERSGR